MQRLPHSGRGRDGRVDAMGALPAPGCVAGELQELAAANSVLLSAGLRDDVRRSVGETSRWEISAYCCSSRSVGGIEGMQMARELRWVGAGGTFSR